MVMIVSSSSSSSNMFVIFVLLLQRRLSFPRWNLFDTAILAGSVHRGGAKPTPHPTAGTFTVAVGIFRDPPY